MPEPDMEAAIAEGLENSSPAAAPVAPAVDPAILAAMKAMMEPLQEKVKALETENQTLREAVQEAQTLPGHLVAGADFAPDPRAARSVVIATRPVREEPELYNKNKPVIDTAGLTMNNASPLSGKNKDLR